MDVVRMLIEQKGKEQKVRRGNQFRVAAICDIRRR